MKLSIIILLYAMSFYCVHSQTLTENLIITDSKDSLLMKSIKSNFDKDGNYCFQVKKGDRHYFITNHDTIGGFKEFRNSYGIIDYTEHDFDLKRDALYYKHPEGTEVFGPIFGDIIDSEYDKTSKQIAVTVISNDSIYLYVSGELLYSDKANQIDKAKFNLRDCISFSENGNAIYYITKNNQFSLYVNQNLIDSSRYEYIQFAINNNGNYIYAQGHKPDLPTSKYYNYMFYIHYMDTVLGYTRTVWDYELKESNAYYYSGDDNGPDYIAINDFLHKEIKAVSNITLMDRDHYLYTYKKDDQKYINANGQHFHLDFQKLFLPSLDSNGNFALYGIKDYYLYKYINGEKSEEPISKYGVRATPLYISPTGESLHYFGTDDSIYIYKDNKLLFEPIHKSSNFKLIGHKEFVDYVYVNGKTDSWNSLFYLEYNESGYFVYNGKFSKPIKPVLFDYYPKMDNTGSIRHCVLNDDGFFVLQKVGKKRYLIIINNEVYQEIDDVDKILSKNFFFDGRTLVFYGIKNYSYYQYKVSL